VVLVLPHVVEAEVFFFGFLMLSLLHGGLLCTPFFFRPFPPVGGPPLWSQGEGPELSLSTPFFPAILLHASPFLALFPFTQFQVLLGQVSFFCLVVVGVFFSLPGLLLRIGPSHAIPLSFARSLS